LIVATPGRMRDSLSWLLASGLDRVAIRTADDGRAARRLVAEQCPALVLLDTNLPGEDAWALLELICANGHQSRCLVLADSMQQQRQARNVGADASLLKGFSTVELYAVVERLLAAREAEGEKCPRMGQRIPGKIKAI
jgi:DNA-binding response OmpR family regulator